MGWQNLAQRKPPGASCNWVKEELAAGAPYRWWRPSSGQGCAVGSLSITTSCSTNEYATMNLVGFTLGGANSNPGAQDANWGGGGLGFCGTFGSYLSSLGSHNANFGIAFDVWKALKDAAWSSSLAITLRLERNAGTTQFTIGPSGSTMKPSAVTKQPTLNGNAAGGSYGCPGSAYTDFTLTIYDDGRFTVV